MSEPKNYRENLERLSQHFTTELVPYMEICAFLGATRKQLNRDKTFPLKKISGRYYVSLVALAKWLS